MALRGIDERRDMPLQHEELRAVALSLPLRRMVRASRLAFGFHGLRKRCSWLRLCRRREDVDGAFYHNHGLAEAVYKTMA